MEWIIALIALFIIFVLAILIYLTGGIPDSLVEEERVVTTTKFNEGENKPNDQESGK